jgi:hypothetical protein
MKITRIVPPLIFSMVMVALLLFGLNQSVVLAGQTAVTSAPISKSIIRPRRICTHGRFLARWQELARVILDALNGPRKLVFALPYDTVIR